jgi:phage gpG-like protein
VVNEQTPIRFSLEVDGERQVDRALSRFGDAIRDPRGYFELAADILREITEEQFASEGGGRWAPLSPAYAAWKMTQVGARPILTFSGRMRRSLTERGGENIREVTNDEMKWGSRVPYAVFHQRGTARMPARPIFDLSEEDRTRLLKELQAWIVGEGM